MAAGPRLVVGSEALHLTLVDMPCTYKDRWTSDGWSCASTQGYSDDSQQKAVKVVKLCASKGFSYGGDNWSYSSTADSWDTVQQKTEKVDTLCTGKRRSHSGDVSLRVVAGGGFDNVHRKAEKVKHLLQLIEPGQRLGNLNAFAKAYCDASFCLRLLQKYGDDVKKSADKLEMALHWREQHEELLTTLRCEEASDLRVIGFDKERRPILYQCCRNQMLSNTRGLEQYVVRMTQAISMMPPGVQTMTHMWDIHGLTLYLNLNPAAVVRLLKVLEGYFAGRLHELIVIDMPKIATFLKDAIWPVMPESTKQKVHFFSAAETITHMKEACNETVSHRIHTIMMQNRNKNNTLEERKCTWVQFEPNAISAS